MVIYPLWMTLFFNLTFDQQRASVYCFYLLKRNKLTISWNVRHRRRLPIWTNGELSDTHKWYRRWLWIRNRKWISVWNITSGKTGLPFQMFRCSRRFPLERTKKSCSFTWDHAQFSIRFVNNQFLAVAVIRECMRTVKIGPDLRLVFPSISNRIFRKLFLHGKQATTLNVTFYRRRKY